MRFAGRLGRPRTARPQLRWRTTSAGVRSTAGRVAFCASRRSSPQTSRPTAPGETGRGAASNARPGKPPWRFQTRRYGQLRTTALPVCRKVLRMSSGSNARCGGGQSRLSSGSRHGIPSWAPSERGEGRSAEVRRRAQNMGPPRSRPQRPLVRLDNIGPTRDVAPLLKEVDADPTGIFWG